MHHHAGSGMHRGREPLRGTRPAARGRAAGGALPVRLPAAAGLLAGPRLQAR